MKTPEYSVVVPVYRSEKTLELLCNRIARVFDETLECPFEIILVDDASPDGSWEKMQELHARDNRIKIIQLARNFGQHNALMCGFTHARGEYIITMDDDLQHPPEEIPKLIKALEAQPDNDVVIGAYITKKHSWLRNIGTRTSQWFASLILKKDPKLQFTSFRLIRATLVSAMIQVKMEKPRIGHLLLQLSNRFINAPVQHDPRKYGKSGFTFKRLVKDLISNILTNSALPLQMVSYFGFFSSFLSFMLSLYFLYRYFFIGISVPGWTTLVLMNLFFFGVLLLSMGVIGEYLIRILKENKRMPQYVVRKKHL